MAPIPVGHGSPQSTREKASTLRERLISGTEQTLNSKTVAAAFSWTIQRLDWWRKNLKPGVPIHFLLPLVSEVKKEKCRPLCQHFL